MTRTATLVQASLAAAVSAGWVFAGEPALPDTVAGRRASAFIAAFNSGDEAAVRRFETEHRAKSAARRRSIDDRVAQLRSLYTDWGRLEVRNVLSGGEHNILVVVEPERADGWLHLNFELEDDPPYGLLGIQIEGPVDPESSAASNKPLDAEARGRVVDRIANELARSYVFEDVGRAMADDIRRRLAGGEYDSYDYSYYFAQRLTDDLRAICHDRHLRVAPRMPLTRRGQRIPRPGDQESRPQDNYGFVKVEILPGNVGYIKLNSFEHGPDAQATAAAAMAFVAHTDALIFDLTDNGGGAGTMITFLCGYLFDQPVHLNTFHNRSAGIVAESYSDENVPGERYGQQKPVYVLTSGYTFSAAEEFTYDLKNLERATVVGETTGGGAHPVTFVTVSKHFTLKVPNGRAENPVTKTNWEGVGVVPHVAVSADQAKEKAHQLALQAVKKAKPPAAANG